MQQRTIITEPYHIKEISKDVHFFYCRKQMFKVQLHRLSDKENLELEKNIVRYYSLGQYSLIGVIPPVTILVYILFIFSGIVPFSDLGIMGTIAMYIPFALSASLLYRTVMYFYAKRGLCKIADELEQTTNGALHMA
jgi:hypothetical protein